MLSLTSAALYRGSHCLFSGASLQIHPGQKAVLVGDNGAGKSSVFSLIRGELSLSEGEISLPKDWQIMHLTQTIDAGDKTAIDYVLSGHELFYGLYVEQNDPDTDPTRLMEIAGIMGDIGGYEIPAQGAKILNGLGFTQADHERAVADFSGGWQMRLNLARCLMAPADLFLLDEPTNHLDLEAILWLEDWVANLPAAVLTISHDRRFLDAIAKSTLVLDQKSLKLYGGHFTQVMRQVSEQHAQAVAQNAQTVKRMDELASFVTRFKAKASKSKQAQSRLKQLERMSEDLVDTSRVDMTYHFRFEAKSSAKSPFFKVTQGVAGYDHPLVDQINLTVTDEARIGLLGTNGSGKSTVLKTLLGEIEQMGGEWSQNPLLEIGVFSQHALSTRLDLTLTPVGHFLRHYPSMSEGEIRSYLGLFGFAGELQVQVVKTFSSGQKARLVLALIARAKPHLLILDEPTNHLDIKAKDALAQSLAAYTGALMVVSHDREFLSLLCDDFYLIQDGSFSTFDGTLEDYVTQVKGARSGGAKEDKATKATPDKSSSVKAAEQVKVEKPKADQAAESADSGLTKAEARKLAADKRAALAPLTKRLKRSEEKLTQANTRLEQIISLLADEALYEESRGDEMRAMVFEQSEVQAEIDALENSVLELMEQIEAFEA